MTITAHVRYLVVIRQFVQEAVRRLGASQRVMDDLIQAVDEMSANVMLHGYQGGPGEIEIVVRREAGGVAVVLRDQAPPFDPASAQEPDLNATLEERAIGGLGVFLSRKLTDEMYYQTRPQGGNELTLIKRSLTGGAQS
jgi:anti-sigma regulatory factor (Ser/Thr protein kinase)